MAQTTKGSKFIGVNIGNLDYTHSSNGSGIGVTLFPSAGVFLTDDFLLGTSVTLGYQRLSIDNGTVQDYSSRTISYGLAPFARYYFAGTTPHRFFGQASVGIERSNTKIELDYIEKYSSTNKNFAVGLGYNYFLTPGAALEVIAGYGRDNNGPSPAIGYLDVRAGFSVFLPSK
jgi:outer membrane protein